MYDIAWYFKLFFDQLQPYSGLAWLKFSMASDGEVCPNSFRVAKLWSQANTFLLIDFGIVIPGGKSFHPFFAGNQYLYDLKESPVVFITYDILPHAAFTLSQILNVFLPIIFLLPLAWL